MFCIHKRTIIFIFLFVFVAGVLLWSRTLLSSTISYKSKAQEVKTLCQKVNRYDIPPINGIGVTPAFVQYYYDTYCKKNENQPLWNGGFAERAKCYTATLVCGNISNCTTGVACFAGVSNEVKCLYKEVDFNKCVIALKAPKQAAPDYVGHRCTTNCTEDIAIGDCVPGYALRCVCEGTRPRYRDDVKCAPTLKPAQCSYGGSIVTVDSSPYKYETETGRFCIVDSKTNKKIAFHCRVDGKILVQGNAVSDKEGYCTNPAPVQEQGDPLVPNTYCGSKHEYWKANKSGYCIVDYGECTTDKQWICRCDDKGTYNYPTLRNNPSECP